MNMYLFLQQPEDLEIVKAYFAQYSVLSKEDLINKYNRLVEIGFLGSKEQARQAIAIHMSFKKNWGYSTITIENNSLITLGDRMENN
jgi:hypothetical protein